MLNFGRLPPHSQLRHLIQGYWRTASATEAVTMQLVPDGYPELFFLMKGGVSARIGEEPMAHLPEAGVIGQMTNRIALVFQPGTQVLCVKLYPWAASILFQTPAHLFSNRVLGLDELGSSLAFRRIAGQLYEKKDFSAAAVLLDDFFLNQLSRLQEGQQFIRFAVKQIFRHDGVLQVNSISHKINASRRYIEQSFKAEVGLSPKYYARLIRVKKASMLLLDSKYPGYIGAVAAELDYYDQSHFLKDFKGIVGCSPSVFLKERVGFPIGQLKEYLGQWDYS